ncbi:anti-phage-associated helicase HerA [Schinkia azotoformans]|uniref:anti-phage-associated helicase HerA n=1 Tax=Schinkia azotoformans TaxID=1454 RepID=UPI002DC0096F|nr:anti-phage-associated helicase HerA [Schinkia azotoformans]MEC1719042.1 ATP-binding protein [Schinkia azotoformans]MED4413909.1 ATP-binding protein [Schinkia azotoformans]
MAVGTDINAEVIAVYPNKVKISVDDLEDFKKADETLRVGSYLRVMDNENSVLISIIENFSIEVSDIGKRKYIIEANPLGLIKGDEFIRGGDSLAIPPKKVEPATEEEIRKIYCNPSGTEDNFTFASLSTNRNIRIPVNGNKFFNKHIAVVGSTGSGKSHTLATILQKAVAEKNGEFSMNNSHIILFDIHSEYKTAFPHANHFDINSLTLPYWLLNSEELVELFLDTDANDHNQRNMFKEAIVQNRKLKLSGSEEEKEKIHFDSPVFFDLNEVLQYLKHKNIERKNTKNEIQWEDENGDVFTFSEDTLHRLFNEKLNPVGTSAAGVNGKLINFLNRLENKINDKRYDFLLGEKSKTITFEETLKNLLGYNEGEESNITVIDLSGVPFEVLSITVSLISRIIFEYGYFYKRLRNGKKPNEVINNDAPILLVYEEAHKYVPNSDLSKYRSSKTSIERIAKEGRKYGVSLLLSSQRPSELSETIFSQCNNFIAMRLTNPHDQNYVKKLLPDTLGNIIEKMPSLKSGEALLIGDSVVLPSIVQIDTCNLPPSSNDIPYWDLWREEWKNIDINSIKDEWYK